MAPFSWKPKFDTAPPKAKFCILSYPAPSVLLVRLNRPKALNCINSEGHIELDQIWTWLDNEPTLSVGILTGTGRAFCAGADLKGMLILPSRHTQLSLNSSQSGTSLLLKAASDSSQILASVVSHAEVVANQSLPQ